MLNKPQNRLTNDLCPVARIIAVVNAKQHFRLVRSFLNGCIVVVKGEVVHRRGLQSTLDEMLVKMRVAGRLCHTYCHSISTGSAVLRHVHYCAGDTSTFGDDVTVVIVAQVGAYCFDCLSLLANRVVAVEELPVRTVTFVYRSYFFFRAYFALGSPT
jgi:hypothetical protein